MWKQLQKTFVQILKIKADYCLTTCVCTVKTIAIKHNTRYRYAIVCLFVITIEVNSAIVIETPVLINENGTS